MCLVVLAWEAHPLYKLIVASNRDEFYNREAKPVHFWHDHPEILAGRDLRSGGTWMGMTRQGKWAALTNYRDLRNIKEDAPSRGFLTTEYLESNLSPSQYLEKTKSESINYNGYNLLVGDLDETVYFSNQSGVATKLGPGIYGLSNHLLDTPWPKVETAKAKFRQAIERATVDYKEIMGILYNTDIYPDKDLPDTGIGMETERLLSSIFIEMPGYGSRCSTVLMVNCDHQAVYVERQYLNGKINGQDLLFRLTLSV